MAGDKAGKRTVKVLVKELKENVVKNANVVVDLRERLESKDVGTTLAAVTGLHHAFTFLLHEHVIQRPVKAKGEDSARQQVNKWLVQMYEETLTSFLQLLQHSETAVQELALSSLVKLLQSEGRHPFRRTSGGGYGFPLKRLKAVVCALVSDSVENQHLIGLLQEYMECEDFAFYTLLALSEMVKTRTKTHTDETVSVAYMNNFFPLLEKVKIHPPGSRPLLPPRLFLHPPREETTTTTTTTKTECQEDQCQSAFTVPYPEARHALNTTWTALLRWPLTPQLYRKVLLCLPDLALPHLEKPLALTGFLMESYNMGGAISLLALQGVFILINKHNLEYPDFYKKLYALLTPTVFHAKYRPRFFMLCDRFLSSTHLPEYLVAAFVKRLARLSLIAPSCCLHLLIRFIANLLVRFPGLQRLVHDPSSTAGREGDPYLPEEPDPARSRAGESSLWEVASLQLHFLPAVARAAAFTKRHTLPTTEANLGQCVEQEYEELFERACKVVVKEVVATTFVQPKGLFLHPDDQLNESWSLC